MNFFSWHFRLHEFFYGFFPHPPPPPHHFSNGPSLNSPFYFGTYIFFIFPAVRIRVYCSNFTEILLIEVYTKDPADPHWFVAVVQTYKFGSLVPRPVRAIRVTRGGLVLGEFSRQA